ncbi:DUF2267 domain-containing protein [Peredibacter starrii]|uniref:DUF2267 domain-containing protein n=1 Tax=Peredibacter starrii TaxID=28202 RepID=A0AAX4HV17_9BACT|nr:DUF2267 domain-containing protein [Peredibacter starrii]WPU66826.1 DUF2267 domain-containing protein [Peredibacter starrii]
MHHKHIKGIDKANEEINHVINLLMESKLFENEQKAFAVLKACLKALRERVGRDEAIHLGSQLSTILRGIYYEGWSPHADVSRSRTTFDFLEDVRRYFHGHDEIDLSHAVPVTLGVIFDLIDQGEAKQVLKNLPKNIQDLYLD